MQLDTSGVVDQGGEVSESIYNQEKIEQMNHEASEYRNWCKLLELNALKSKEFPGSVISTGTSADSSEVKSNCSTIEKIPNLAMEKPEDNTYEALNKCSSSNEIEKRDSYKHISLLSHGKNNFTDKFSVRELDLRKGPFLSRSKMDKESDKIEPISNSSSLKAKNFSNLADNQTITDVPVDDTTNRSDMVSTTTDDS